MTARQQSFSSALLTPALLRLGSPFAMGTRECRASEIAAIFDHAQGAFQPMTRKRDRRSSPPSFGSRNPPPAAGGQPRKPAPKAEQSLERSNPRGPTGERREAKVSLIYGFHSVGAALKA